MMSVPFFGSSLPDSRIGGVFAGVSGMTDGRSASGERTWFATSEEKNMTSEKQENTIKVMFCKILKDHHFKMSLYQCIKPLLCCGLWHSYVFITKCLCYIF